MRKLILIAGCLAIVALLAAPIAMAATTTWLPAFKAASTTGTYRRPNMPVDSDPVQMHGMKPRDTVSSFAPPAVTKTGPMAMGDDLQGGRAGLVAPTGGGPMYSPKEQGDREITRLIRQLG